MGYQWEGIKAIDETRRDHPNLKIMQTETDCGNWFWKLEFIFNPDHARNDLEYAVYTWNSIKEYFLVGANSYLLWNMILDEEGKNFNRELPWPQNYAIMVDTRTREVIYTPMFYAFKHFSYFIEPGAHLVEMKQRAKLQFPSSTPTALR